jgi:hypothetical protein
MTMYDGSGSNAPRPQGFTNRQPIKKLRSKVKGRAIKRAVRPPKPRRGR